MTLAGWRAGSWVALGALALGLAMLTGAESKSPAPPRLTPGVAIEDTLDQGQTRLYVFSARRGDLIDIAISQYETEVMVTLQDPQGREWLRLSHPLPERILALAGATGNVFLYVSPDAGASEPGRFELTLRLIQSPTQKMKELAEASSALADADAVRASDLESSLGRHQRLLTLATRYGRRELQAITEYRMGLILEKLARRGEAIQHYQRAKGLYERIGRDQTVADLWSAIGSASYDKGDFRNALLAYRTSFALYERRAGRLARANAAGALANIALSSDGLGEVGNALNANEEALRRYGNLGGHIEQRSTILVNLANLHLGIGQPEEAQKRIEKVEDLLRGAEDLNVRARALSNLAGYFDNQGQVEKALDLAPRALDLCRQTGDSYTESYTLIRLARSLAKVRQLDEAEQALRRAIVLARQHKDPLTEGQALANLGITYALRGSGEKGLELLDQSLLRFESLDTLNSLSLALYEKARIQRDLGQLAEAERTLRRALEISEELRSHARDRSLRTSIAAQRRSHVELQVELLMQLSAQREDPGLMAAAFEASESAHARTLFEDLVERRRFTEAVDDAEDARILKIGELLDEQMRHWQDLGLQIESAQEGERAGLREKLSDLERRMKGLAAERERLRSARRASVSGSLEVPWRQPLHLSEIQRNVLGPDQVLLSYWLGDAGSFVWVVTQNSIESHALPKGSEIEDLVEEARKYLDKPHDWNEKRAMPVLRKLSAALIDPVRGSLAGKTLLISPDGALGRLPFALLPESRNGDRPLIEDHAIVTIPSASILESLQSSLRGRVRAPNVAFIMADPIFTRQDERVLPRESAPGESALPRDSDRQRGTRSLISLRRLEYSGAEGEEILRLAPPGRSRLALGEDASLELIRSPELGTYQYLHFATHGFLNSEPELSSLILSRYDEEGEAHEGILPAYEISQLKLPVELVVLSACETGLAEENGKEEVSGLSRAFLYAGARRVVASLWNVDDRATTELMMYFYSALWREGLSPAQALRKAQREMRKTEDFAAPVYWAGFVLQGEE